EHRLEVERRTDRLTNVTERLELADRSRELLRPRLQLGQQARIFDRDHRLVGKGLEERDLVVGEAAGFTAGHGDRSDRLALTQHRDNDLAVVSERTRVSACASAMLKGRRFRIAWACVAPE